LNNNRTAAMKFNVRLADSADAQLISNIASASFTDTFSRYNSMQDVNAYTDEFFAPQRLKEEIDSSESVFFICFKEDSRENTLQDIPCGFLKLRKKNTNYITDDDAIELQRIYILTEYQGTGASQLLMNAAIDYSVENNYKTLWLGTWENNIRAIKFYKKFDFVEFGDHIFKIGSSSQRDILLKKRIF